MADAIIKWWFLQSYNVNTFHEICHIKQNSKNHFTCPTMKPSNFVSTKLKLLKTKLNSMLSQLNLLNLLTFLFLMHLEQLTEHRLLQLDQQLTLKLFADTFQQKNQSTLLKFLKLQTNQLLVFLAVQKFLTRFN